MPPLGNQTNIIDQTPVNLGPQLIASTVRTDTAGHVNYTEDQWREWNQIYTLVNGALSTAITTGICSYQFTGERAPWPFNTTVTATTAGSVTWGVWNDRYDRIMEAGGATRMRAAQIAHYSRRKLTEEELLVELEREKKMREDYEKKLLKAKTAEKRAEDLLRLCLSDQQIEDLEKRNCFYVDITSLESNKKERYRIDRGSHGNVKQVDERGAIIRSFCIQPDGVPNGDVLLTQKLWLEASEASREEFWATANISAIMHEKAIPHTVPRHERRRYAEVHGLLH